MADIAVETVDTKAQQRRFVRLPWRLYEDDPCWMPPLIMSQEELLGFRPHPFYEKSRSRSFLATRGGRDVGRITALVNAGHIERYHEQRGSSASSSARTTWRRPRLCSPRPATGCTGRA